MTIEFDLAGLHLSFVRPVVDALRGLDADYPGNPLRRVELYRSAGDESMGNSDRPGVISLNARWFSRPIDELREASRDQDLVHLRGGDLVLPWHGGMEEPNHVLSHEFGHQLQATTPWWRGFAEPHWRASCLDPIHQRPVSGYALNDPEEFWADTFAAMRLGVAREITRLMRERFGRA